MSHPLGAWLKIKHLRLQPTFDRTTDQSTSANLPRFKNENHFSLFTRSEREKSEEIKNNWFYYYFYREKKCPRIYRFYKPVRTNEKLEFHRIIWSLDNLMIHPFSKSVPGLNFSQTGFVNQLTVRVAVFECFPVRGALLT